MKNDAGDGVNHRCECGDGKDVTSDFDGTLFGGAFDFLQAFGVRHRADVPYVEKNFTGLRKKERRQLAIEGPSASDGPFINGAGFGVEKEGDRRNVGLRAIHADVALALLLGIVERMSVKEGPDELTTDVFEAEFEVRMLVNRMMTAEKSGGANVEALLVVDFFGTDEARGVAGTRGSDCGIEGMRETVSESDTWWRRLNEFLWISTLKHARLGGHSRKSFYTGKA